MEEWFRARDHCPKPSLASKDVIHPWLREQMPARTMFYKMIYRNRPPPPTTPTTQWYFHGTFPHTVWRIAAEEEFMNSVNGSPEGHEASVSGLYCSDQFDTGIGYYGWPANLFGDGIFYRFGFVVQAEHRHNECEVWPQQGPSERRGLCRQSPKQPSLGQPSDTRVVSNIIFILQTVIIHITSLMRTPVTTSMTSR